MWQSERPPKSQKVASRQISITIVPMQQILRPPARFGFPLFLVMALLSGFLLWLALSRSYTQLEELTAVEATARAELSLEQTRSVDLLVTQAYADSPGRAKDYIENEAINKRDGEIILEVEVTAVPSSLLVIQPEDLDVQTYSRPWQMWWQLLTDQPMPTAP